MPPVTKAGGEQFRKDVEFVTKDDDDQIASGIVMVPDKADLQNDFAREETIRGFADQFETFEEAGEAGGGIMHAVFPDDWMDLERNEVLDDAEEIGGEEVPAGAWIQDWQINNDQLWDLVKDDILAGYSIGARDVSWNGPYEQDEVDDVEVPEELGDELVWELADGLIREVSTVDIPAVPDAQILDTKAAAEKRLGDYLGDPNGFVEEALERGHSEEEAEQLWDVLSTAAEVEGAGAPGEKSVFERLGKAVFEALPGRGESTGTASRGAEAPYEGAESGCWEIAVEDGTEGYQHSETGEFVPVDEADADIMADINEAESDAKDATGSDTPGDDGGSDGDVDAASDTDNMSNDNPDDGGSDAKELAEKNAEQISELTAAVEDLTESLTGPEAKTAEIEIGGETYEVQEDAAKAALGVDEETSVADAIEQLNSQVERANNRIDAINRQSGASGQVDPAAAKNENEGDGEGSLDGLGKALS
ncbi:XkdF-like putative serine protease domain-containing protein [Halorussus marinus]|uniref:XkdF-like putative serine protease domain-containing protein n=1 Tax=Halorussus marinus TaxID=2505976 RepID=UPI001091F8DB|nr:XkdF-like putative serine protease domain-containing protein [Halorussus marinus]